MNQNPKPADEKYTKRETAERRDAAIKRMLNTPPKSHSEMKIGKTKEHLPEKRAKKTAKRAAHSRVSLGTTFFTSHKENPSWDLLKAS
jgi:hypothetical protein